MRILFLGPLRSSFANVDVEMLKREHTVHTIDTVLGHGIEGILSLLSVSFRSCWQVFRTDVLYCWFADYHTLLPTLVGRLLRKRVVIVAGGYDIGYEPQINFGARVRPLRWWFTKNTFRYASKILAVSEYALRQLQGLTAGNHASAEVVYNAVRTHIADDAVAEYPRDRMVVTVSQGESDVEIRRKGIDVFVRIAKQMPDVKFRLIGLAAKNKVVQNELQSTPNLEVFPGFVSFEDVVLPSYKSASVYAQLSIEEAFGVAIVESMICGCIPVSTGKAALAEVVGPCGLIATSDVEIISAIREALNGTKEQRRSARTRGLEFSAERRSKGVLASVANIH